MSARGHHVTLFERDDWYCDVSPSWVVNRACFYLDARRIESPALDRGASAQRTGVWANTTQNVSPVYTPPLPNSVRVM